ncbi:hypothetical protein V6N13_138169 [Hibiscus sabdariffa]|uniref:Uncharacterized protein n=1 Tax=Hibiscus sabdariffa TaxID=183260 RepID=A0ABR2QCR3_9ROSI
MPSSVFHGGPTASCRSWPPKGGEVDPSCSDFMQAITFMQVDAGQGSGRSSPLEVARWTPSFHAAPHILQVALLPNSSQLRMGEGLVPQTRPPRGGVVPLIL